MSPRLQRMAAPLSALCLGLAATAAAWALTLGPLRAEAATPAARAQTGTLASQAERFFLAPGSAELGVGRRLQLTPIKDDCVGDSAECLLAPGPSAVVWRWAVNGIDGGNDEVGRVRALPDGSAEYVAPARVPRANPVSVAATLAGTGRGRVMAMSEIQIVGPEPRWTGWVEVEAHASLAGRDGVLAQQGELHYRVRLPLGRVLSETREDDGSRFVALQFDAPDLQVMDMRLRTDLGPETCNTERWRTVQLSVQPGAPPAPLTWTLRVGAAGEVRSDFVPLPPLLLGGHEELGVKGCGTGTRVMPLAPQLMSFEGLNGPFTAPRADAQGVSTGSFQRQVVWRVEGRERPLTLSVRWQFRTRAPGG